MFTTRGEAQYEEGCVKSCIVCSRQGSHFHLFMKVVQMLIVSSSTNDKIYKITFFTKIGTKSALFTKIGMKFS